MAVLLFFTSHLSLNERLELVCLSWALLVLGPAWKQLTRLFSTSRLVLCLLLVCIKAENVITHIYAEPKSQTVQSVQVLPSSGYSSSTSHHNSVSVFSGIEMSPHYLICFEVSLTSPNRNNWSLRASCPCGGKHTLFVPGQDRTWL